MLKTPHLFLSAKTLITKTSTETALILWFQSSGALGMCYLFAEQVKCMHKLPPNYNDTRENKLVPQNSTSSSQSKITRKALFSTDIVNLPWTEAALHQFFKKLPLKDKSSPSLCTFPLGNSPGIAARSAARIISYITSRLTSFSIEELSCTLTSRSILQTLDPNPASLYPGTSKSHKARAQHDMH